mgnify:CR=1 FL=1
MNRRLLSVVVGGALVALAAPAKADLTELKWASEGYFRTRTVTLSNLAPQPRVVTSYPANGEQLIIPDIRSTSYVVSRLRLMRQWAGMVDVSPDTTPVMGLTPVEGLYINCGWGTGGFKAIPGSGWAMAELMARGGVYAGLVQMNELEA